MQKFYFIIIHKMPGTERKEIKESSDSENYLNGFKKEETNLFFLTEKIQVEWIVNELSVFINPSDFWKRSNFIDYICSWKLWSNENKDLEKMANYIIYWSYEQTYPRTENPWSRKLKYILDNYWKSFYAILVEIQKKEKEMKPKVSPKPKEEKKEWIVEWAIDRLKDAYNYWIDKLSGLWSSIVKAVPSRIKNWVKDNLFSPEKQKNTENINDIYQKLKWPEKPDFLPFYLAMQWYNKKKNSLWNKKYLTVVDYSKPVSQQRLYVINMESLTVENCVRTWHGKNSGNMQETTKFSNTQNSNQTSIGFFRTPQDLSSNSKRTRRWLFLQGMEYSNDKARDRWIAVHSVWNFFYSRTEKWHRAWDSTSEGCITIRSVDNPNEIMNKIKWDSLIYSYYPDITYLTKSTMIK